MYTVAKSSSEQRKINEKEIHDIYTKDWSELGFGEVHRGRPKLFNEGNELRTISVTIPKNLINLIDKRTDNRSEFCREAIAEKVAKL